VFVLFLLANRKALEALEMSSSGRILKDKDLKPKLHAKKTELSKEKSAKKGIQAEGVKALNRHAATVTKVMDISSDDDDSSSNSDVPLKQYEVLYKNKNKEKKTEQVWFNYFLSEIVVKHPSDSLRIFC